MIFHKLLPLIFLPQGLVLFLIGFLILYVIIKKTIRHKDKIFLLPTLLMAFVILWVSSTPFFASYLMETLENSTQKPTLKDIKSCDAVVILGGALKLPDYRIENREWKEQVNRFEMGLRVFKHGVPKIFFTPGRNPWLDPSIKSGGKIQLQKATERGIPKDVIFIADQMMKNTYNTHAEALGIRNLCQKNNIKKIALVTSAWHLPRSCFIFREVLGDSVEIIPTPCDFLSRQFDPHPLLWVAPDARATSMTSLAVREYLGLLWYKLTGVSK